MCWPISVIGNYRCRHVYRNNNCNPRRACYLVRVRKYSFIMALLSCIPGGQAEVTAMSRDLVEKDYVVALFILYGWPLCSARRH